MFIPNLKEAFELVFKNEDRILVRNTDIFLFILNLFATVPCESPPALLYVFTEHPEAILYCIWYIENILPNFPDNPNSPESEQRSAAISSDSQGSTVSVKARPIH
ncbi:hypothetical protein AVEN_179407-1 [Araneus ventricosus]|uniref:Uncharacterized protein n=1 Tax=Araneus ventricosus TaxID=182803 RepID=A0A4Y2BEM0_ARAVE|nr:hypothetical protein AVEN_179407-1 [Araneus ventricosus]